MLGKRVERAVGRGDRLDIETLVKRARKEFRRLECCCDAIEIEVGDIAGEPLLEAEERREHMVEPHAARRASEEVVVFGEEPPDRTRIEGPLLAPSLLAGNGRHSELA